MAAVKWERVDDQDSAGPPLTTAWERIDDLDEIDRHPAVAALSNQKTLKSADAGRKTPLSKHSQEGRRAKAYLEGLSILELKGRLAAQEVPFDDSISNRSVLVERLLDRLGVEHVLAEMGGFPDMAETAEVAQTPTTVSGPSSSASSSSTPGRIDYSRFDSIDYERDYGLQDAERQAPPPASVDLFQVLCSSLPDEQRRQALQQALQQLQQGAPLRTPPAPPAPDCEPVAWCTPECELDAEAADWHVAPGAESAGPPADQESIWYEEGQQEESASAWALAEDCASGFGADGDEGEEGQQTDEEERAGVPASTSVEGHDEEEEVIILEERDDGVARRRLHEAYSAERRRLDKRGKEPSEVDVDGWGMEKSQQELVEEADEDVLELRVLLHCAERAGNKARLQRALREFEVTQRVRRTWAWFPLTRYEWTGFEYGKPIITLDYKVPAVGSLPPEDIHCDFGTDWFDLKVWNVTWPEEPETKYHHRVKKTRLMRDIVPSECSVKAQGDHLYVHLQKVSEPRHGFCAWPDLAAGKGRKPFKYQEDAPDGGLMDFFEGQYEKHEGYDGFRRDIGKAMEKVHRGEPIPGIPDTPEEDD